MRLGLLKTYLLEAGDLHHAGYRIYKRPHGKYGWKHGGEDFDSTADVMSSIQTYIKKNNPKRDDKDQY